MPVSDVFTAVEEHDVVLVLVNQNNFRDVADKLIAGFVDDGAETVVLTADRNFEEIREDMVFHDIDPEEYYIVDLVAEKEGFEGGDDRVQRISSPTAFNDITVAFADLYEQMEDHKRAVVLDSLTAWLLYGGLKRTGNFVKKLTDKAKENNAQFIVLAMNTLIDEETVDRLMTFCEEKIDLTDERLHEDI